ncbi:hypothetical protein B0H10DRAFT_2267207 [Mycena sp. CBHHK59/15]|nr:hypothetical protein B0H10DRAFT_2267207 [Mycena sp. CBHHK59/15]
MNSSGIDQINHVYAKVHEATMKETGWVGMVIMGGPMPRRGGQISTKTICFGETTNGFDFQALHPDFEGDVKKHFNKFLKHLYPHEIRDARGFPAASTTDEGDSVPASSDALDGLIPFDPDQANEDEGMPAGPQFQRPKRMRRPKHAAAVSALSAPGSASVSASASPPQSAFTDPVPANPAPRPVPPLRFTPSPDAMATHPPGLTRSSRPRTSTSRA